MRRRAAIAWLAAALAASCVTGPHPISTAEIEQIVRDALHGDPISDLALQQDRPDHYIGTGRYRGAPNLVVEVTIGERTITYDAHTTTAQTAPGLITSYRANGELPMPANRTRQQP